MYERETESRKWQICSLFTACAVFSAALGGIHTYRALNARKVNSDLQHRRDELFCKEIEGGCHGNLYDSCLAPTYLYGNTDPSIIEDAYSSLEDWCDGDQDCL